METTPTNGVAIEAVVYPLNEGTATRMTVLSIELRNNCNNLHNVLAITNRRRKATRTR
jgi:hypothetical protein